MKHKRRKDAWRGSQKFPTLKEVEREELDKKKRIREIRNRRAIARRSTRRDFLTLNLDRSLLRTETDPFTRDKIYKKDDGTRAKVETEPILARATDPQRPEYHVQTHQYFSDPLSTVVCHNRKRRRRVLFALGIARRGATVSRRHIWTATSRIRCK